MPADAALAQLSPTLPAERTAARQPHVAADADRAERCVLMISYAFPPSGGPGVYRSVKFAKHLPQFGWRPVVWAADYLADLPYDPTLLAGVPESVAIHRFPPRAVQPSAPRSTSAAMDPPSERSGPWRAGLGWRLRRWRQVAAGWLVPDPQVFWALRSYRRLLRLIADQRVELIHATYSPPSNLLLGWLLHRATGLPWVADFRDLWTDDYSYGRSPWRRRVDRVLENVFLQSAAAVLAVTTGQRAVLAGRCPARAENCYCIPNGFDADDFVGLDPAAARAELHGPQDEFVLLYAGWLMSCHTGPELVAGLADFAAEVRAQGRRFVLRLLGSAPADWLRSCADAGITVDRRGYVPHAQAVRHLAAADLLLLAVPPMPGGAAVMTGKVFEYLASGRPILAVGPPDSEPHDLIRRLQAGWAVPSDAKQVNEALRAAWAAWSRGELRSACTAEQLAPYSRRHRAGQLAELFTHILSASPVPWR